MIDWYCNETKKRWLRIYKIFMNKKMATINSIKYQLNKDWMRSHDWGGREHLLLKWVLLLNKFTNVFENEVSIIKKSKIVKWLKKVDRCIVAVTMRPNRKETERKTQMKVLKLHFLTSEKLRSSFWRNRVPKQLQQSRCLLKRGFYMSYV